MNLGIYTPEQYDALGEERRFAGARVAYNLLDVGLNPSPKQVLAFEDICVTLRTANGTFRTSFRHRFRDLNARALAWLSANYKPGEALLAEDRAVSHGLTSVEWAQEIFGAFPDAKFQASDLLLYLLELRLASGEIFITDRQGSPLQYIRPPYVVSAGHWESWRNPFLRGVCALAKLKFSRLQLPDGWPLQTSGLGFEVRKISCIHPEAEQLSRAHANFEFLSRSVFERSAAPVNVLRTMNILNRAYFTDAQLAEGAAAAFDSLLPGGLWIVGRSLESDFSNHASFLQRGEGGWTVVDRLGSGSEIEELAVQAPGLG